MLGWSTWWRSSGDLQDPSETDIAVSSELFAPGAPGVELCYQTFGDPDDEPLLLVMGLGGPMTWWDPALCRMLAERGFYVIRYDNRDTGRSTKVAGRVSRTMLVRAFSGRHVRTPYAPRATWRPTRSRCSTTSASSRPTSPGCRWAG